MILLFTAPRRARNPRDFSPTAKARVEVCRSGRPAGSGRSVGGGGGPRSSLPAGRFNPAAGSGVLLFSIDRLKRQHHRPRG